MIGGGFEARSVPAGDLLKYNALMANPNPLAGVVPQVVHPVNDGETTITEPIEKIEGEVALDTYVKAQTSAPEVVERITQLENCLWRLADAVLHSASIGRHPELRAAAEEAKLVLKNRLEVEESKHRFPSELGRIEP
jgi:Zn-dependent oligopeptidase